MGLWFDPTAGREGSWVAKTRRLDENVDAETVEYYAGPRTNMKRLMERYCFLHKDYEPPTFIVRNAQCPCCESRESETIQHTLFECEAFEEERKVFLSRLYSVCPLARQLNDEYRCRLVMGDKLPREIENPLYRYLIAISRLRLGILTERGEGS